DTDLQLRSEGQSLRLSVPRAAEGGHRKKDIRGPERRREDNDVSQDARRGPASPHQRGDRQVGLPTSLLHGLRQRAFGLRRDSSLALASDAGKGNVLASEISPVRSRPRVHAGFAGLVLEGALAGPCPIRFSLSFTQDRRAASAGLCPISFRLSLNVRKGLW